MAKVKAIWIESTMQFNDLAVGTKWGGGGFKNNSEKLRAFNAIKAALEKEFPDRVVNPWSDAPWGTPDFDTRSHHTRG